MEVLATISGNVDQRLNQITEKLNKQEAETQRKIEEENKKYRFELEEMKKLQFDILKMIQELTETIQAKQN